MLQGFRRPHWLVLPVLLLLSLPLLAADASDEIAFFSMSVGLLGGLAIFLFGMETMSDALKRVAGTKVKNLLAKLTTNRFSGMLSGAGLTAVIQSSSVTTVLVVGFISAGLMTLPQAVGVIMGANIGTTMTAQIIAFKVTQAALGMVGVGFMMFFASKKESVKQYGNMIFGLGLIFLGMNLMSDAMAPLRSYEPFINLMAQMDNALLAILIAALFTALVQSSSATTGIVIVMAAQGFIPLETGIALSMGANIGTCVTAILASIGKGREALQTSTVHVLFNVIGVIIWLPLISYLGQGSIAISPLHPELDGIERLAAEIPRQIANANTLFNVLNTVIMLPFAGAFVWAVRKLIPPEANDKKAATPITPQYINDDFLATPDIALEQTQLEVARLGRRVCRMLSQLPPLAPNAKTPAQLAQVRATFRDIEAIEEEVDQLHVAILVHLGKLRRGPLSAEQSTKQITLVGMTDHLENIADLIIHGLLPLSNKALNDQLSVSATMRQTLDTIQSMVNGLLLDCVNGIRRNEPDLARRAVEAKQELYTLLDAVLAHQALHLSDDQPNRLRVFRYEMEWGHILKNIYAMTERIAKMQLAEGN